MLRSMSVSSAAILLALTTGCAAIGDARDTVSTFTDDAREFSAEKFADMAVAYCDLPIEVRQVGVYRANNILRERGAKPNIVYAFDCDGDYLPDFRIPRSQP